MKNKIYMVVLAITLIVFAVSCKSSSEVMGTNPGGNNGSNEVSVRDSSFSPGSLTIPVGTTVTWRHTGSMVHTVTSGTRGNPSGLFNSGDMNNGDTFQFTFSSTGTFPYYCTYHNGMNGTIIVQ